MTHERGNRRGGTSIDELLEELAELRELDQQRNAHAPRFPAHDLVTRDPLLQRCCTLRTSRRGLPSGATRTG